MNKQNNPYIFWTLFIINVFLAVCFGLFWNGISITFSFFVVWLNGYLFAAELRKMLVLDTVFQACMQAAAWISYVRWLGQEEAIDNITVSLTQLSFLLTFYFNVCLILLLTAKSLLGQKRKKAACVVAGIAIFQIVFFAWSFWMVS